MALIDCKLDEIWESYGRLFVLVMVDKRIFSTFPDQDGY